MAFSSIPVLDFSLARNPDTKEPFLDSLRHALLEVGFLYIKNIGISDALIKDVINQGRAFFDLPEEKKLEVQMKNMSTLSTTFTSLIAEALHMPPTAFDRFFDKDQQHKLKIVKYPDVNSLPENQQQGVGPHKDSMLTSYLLQASHHRGLQAQNLNGEWIDCPPIPGTLVVAIGQGLEALTHGVCTSTTHRVLSPAMDEGPRFSIPFFQGVSYDATFESVNVPIDILKIKDDLVGKRGGERRDDVEFTFTKGRWGHLGEATLTNRIRSHPDVGERWYPEILARVREEERKAAGKRQRQGEEKKQLPAVNEAKGKKVGTDGWISLSERLGITA
ncbi:MAG: hypothetical protein Q9208_004391 [Pyrenodesmia sp. 3 TL-2023]